ncbi:MAG: ABC transporter ATP-binding protein [Cyclobacteriaceae bacterium]|nr:ABC transporter ATP-binding protein [Cyclobacteriaceae bacterium]
MSDVVIQVRDLSKRFRLGARESSADSLVQSVWYSLQAPFRNYRRLKRLTSFDKEDETVFWALRDINFDVKQGEVLGIIGHNGAGKSTLLKILSRITEPTAGEVELKGRVSSLLEVGTGFHPDLTGRENVYMNGTILGMTKREIDRKFDEIVEFSGVAQHIDTPVKFYSSGMKVRLGFAVAAHLEPEILIVDEVLSVGDIGFQRKCIGKMNEVADSGRTVLFVSHNMAAVENLCSVGLLLDHGSNLFFGSVSDTVHQYISIFRPQNNNAFLTMHTKRTGKGYAQLVSFWLEDKRRNRIDLVKTGDTIYFNFKINARKELLNLDIGFSVHREEDDQLLFILYSSYTGKLFQVKEGEHEISCVIPTFPLPEGKFLVKAQLMLRGEVLDFPQAGVGYLEVVEGDFFGTGTKSKQFTRANPSFLVKGDWS